MEKYEGKSRGKWKKWELRRKIKMRGGNIAGRHVSEGCKEAGSRCDALRVGREAELKWRGVCQASLCFCRMNPMHAASAPVPFLTLTVFPTCISLELCGVRTLPLRVPVPHSLSFQKSFMCKVLKRELLAREELL